MALGNYLYTANDGITYQIGADSSTVTAGAGDLSPATGGELIFPAFNVPRSMLCKDSNNVQPTIVRVPCQANNSLYLNGPGGTLTIGTQTYTIIVCIGEVLNVFVT